MKRIEIFVRDKRWMASYNKGFPNQPFYAVPICPVSEAHGFYLYLKFKKLHPTAEVVVIKDPELTT